MTGLGCLGWGVGGAGCGVRGAGCGVGGSGLGVGGSGFGVRGSGFGVRGSGFGVRGSAEFCLVSIQTQLVIYLIKKAKKSCIFYLLICSHSLLFVQIGFKLFIHHRD